MRCLPERIERTTVRQGPTDRALASYARLVPEDVEQRTHRLREASFLHSSSREALIEHVFIAEVLQEAWFAREQLVEVLRSEVDAAGYDVVFECGPITRHVQLKASDAGGKTSLVGTPPRRSPERCPVGQDLRSPGWAATRRSAGVVRHPVVGACGASRGTRPPGSRWPGPGSGRGRIAKGRPLTPRPTHGGLASCRNAQLGGALALRLAMTWP